MKHCNNNCKECNFAIKETYYTKPPFEEKKFDDLFVSLQKFISLNQIKPDLIKPIVNKIFSALNKIFFILNFYYLIFTCLCN